MKTSLGIITAIVGKYGSVTGCEVECAGECTTKVDCSASLALMEVEPFFGLLVEILADQDHKKEKQRMKKKERKSTFGCQ